MKQNTTGLRMLAALLSTVCAVGVALPASADFPPALVNAALTSQKAGSYHMQMTDSSGGHTMSSTGDVQSLSPMKMRMTTDMGTGGPTGTIQMVILAPNSYMKMGSAGWKKLPADPSAYQQMDVASRLAKDKDKYVVTDLGMQSKGGQMLHGYKALNKVTNVAETIFLDGAGRFARVELGNMVMQFSNYGESLNIAAPM